MLAALVLSKLQLATLKLAAFAATSLASMQLVVRGSSPDAKHVLGWAAAPLVYALSGAR